MEESGLDADDIDIDVADNRSGLSEVATTRLRDLAHSTSTGIWHMQTDDAFSSTILPDDDSPLRQALNDDAFEMFDNDVSGAESQIRQHNGTVVIIESNKSYKNIPSNSLNSFF
jgi:hypothetical protein